MRALTHEEVAKVSGAGYLIDEYAGANGPGASYFNNMNLYVGENLGYGYVAAFLGCNAPNQVNLLGL